MDTILIKLWVPILKTSYDLFVPVDMKIGEMIQCISKGIADLAVENYEPSGKELLSSRNPERIFNPELTLRQYAIAEGEELLLL